MEWHKMKYNELWNDLPQSERKRLMPHMIETQIRHIEQCKAKAISNHKAHMNELNDWINSLKSNLNKMVK